MTITIDEAIKGLKNIHLELSRPGREKDWQSLLLGIEALKRVKGNRMYPQPTVYALLPGETKE